MLCRLFQVLGVLACKREDGQVDTWDGFIWLGWAVWRLLCGVWALVCREDGLRWCVLLLTVVLLCLTSVWGDENILVGFIPPDINNGLLSIIVE